MLNQAITKLEASGARAQARAYLIYATTPIELQLKVKSSDEKIASLESDLSTANNKVHNLRHERFFFIHQNFNECPKNSGAYALSPKVTNRPCMSRNPKPEK